MTMTDSYRHSIETTEELGRWYDAKYKEMGDGWETPADECNAHLDDLGVTFNKALKLLDVGCGAGHFLVEAQKRVTAEGVEISEAGIEYAYRRGVVRGNIGCVSIESKAIVDGVVPGQYDYIVSMGSLEHVIDIHAALDNIRYLLKYDGKFYFFCPNERWQHFDQPNERAMSDGKWIDLFAAHGLMVRSMKRWNDSTAFIGDTKRIATDLEVLPPHGNKLNIGSGQRRFDTAHGWINIDCVSRPPDQIPDLICDVGKDPLPYGADTMDVAVLHHMYEHLHLGEGHGLVREIYRTLKKGGSMIVTVPDLRALAQRWLTGQIDNYIYCVNVYGAYQGLPSDTHAWGYDLASLSQDLRVAADWSAVRPFNWREIPGAAIGRDWWILGVEAVK